MREPTPGPTRPGRRASRTAFALVVAAMLVSSVIGGLLRAGVAVPWPGGEAWLGRVALAHAFLMICAFMGTVIGVERAVALKRRFAFVAPGASATAGVLMSMGMTASAAWLAVLASVMFIAANAAVVARQRADHTLLLLVGAAAWLVGNLLHAGGAPPDAVAPWWFSFLVLTIAAERLEMTRLMRRRRGAAPALHACLAAMLLGSAALALSPKWGSLLYGLALTALALWLALFDIARRTIVSHGLSRYMAVCLLLGYGWLGVSGLAWVTAALGYPARDIALHALGIGFVFSMMLGHAPVILPAVTRVKLHFGGFFYVPVGLLHASLALRLFGGLLDPGLRSVGAMGNAAAVAVFALTMLGSAIAWRSGHLRTSRKPLRSKFGRS